MTEFSDVYGEIQGVCYDTSAATLANIKSKINRYVKVLQQTFLFDETKLQDVIRVTSATAGDSGVVTIEGYIDYKGKVVYKKENISVNAEGNSYSSYTWLQVNDIRQNTNNNGELTITTKYGVYTIATIPAGGSKVIEDIKIYKPHPTMADASDTFYLPAVAQEFITNRVAADVLMSKGDPRQNDFWARSKANMKELSRLYPQRSTFGLSEETYSL